MPDAVDARREMCGPHNGEFGATLGRRLPIGGGGVTHVNFSAEIARDGRHRCQTPFKMVANRPPA
jgi:hypothetical protein